MLVKANTYSVQRDAQTIIFCDIPDYEALVLKQIFGKENVVKQDVAAPVDRDEMNEGSRLVAKYGVANVQAAFGAAYETEVQTFVKKAVATTVRKAKKSEPAAEPAAE